jgi:hypothetical protein
MKISLSMGEGRMDGFFGGWRRGLAGATATALLTLLAGTLGAQQGGGVPLNPDHPERYVVKPGDTLWDISSMFLRDPWYWPEIWNVNPQVANPHLIYPGDVLTLVFVDGQPRVQLERGAAATGTERLSPRIREEDLTEAVTAIPYDVIAPFLTKGMVLERNEIEKLPYVVALREGRLMGATGNDAYVRGTDLKDDITYNVIHVGDKLVDPDNGDVLGYEGVFVGEGNIRRGGDPATMVLNRSAREALEGDRLLEAQADISLQFFPRAPDRKVDGQVIHVVDGVGQFGQYQVVAINRGERHGLAPGHVLTIWQAGDKINDRVKGGLLGRKVQLPDEQAGTVMVFKAYDRLSYALVMRSSTAMKVLDRVRNPG